MNLKLNGISHLIENIKAKTPLIHNITNYVTVNDCANIELAIGASPIMTDEINEVEGIVAISDALVLNIGTLNQRTIESMIVAGKAANKKGIPVILDPVGAGASPLRNETTLKILNEVKVSILRGNLSEISFCAGAQSNTKGVDSSEKDGKNDITKVALAAAKTFNCVVAVTGKTDVITDGKRILKIENGNAMLSGVTGSGCMTTCLVGAFAGANDDLLLAAACGVMVMGIAGEIAYEKTADIGIGSFHIAIIDAVGNLNKSLIEQRAKIYEEKN